MVEFSENEPRLLQKLEPKFRELLESQKSKSVQYELIQASLKLFKKDYEDGQS